MSRTTDELANGAAWLRRVVCLILAMVIGLMGPLSAYAQTVVYFHNDPAGSPIAATDASGNVLWRESYRPYGERMLKPAAANTQWFHGKSLDPDTGMEDFGARNYDPVLGRFLSIDPVDFTEKNIHSFNRYAYGNNNPLKYKDPDGRFPVALIALAVLKAADVAMTAYDTYKSYQEGGAREAGKTLAIAAAMSAIPGGKAAGKAVHAAEEVAVAAKGGIGRSGAFREAKRDLGIPRLQDPEAVSHIPMTDRTGKNILGENGRPIMTREYTYKRPDGSTVVIQEHSAGHQFGAGGVGDQGSHFNVRPPENTRSGSVPGTKDHYSW